MAFRHGKSADFTINAVNIGGFMTSMETSWDLDVAETTVFKATWKSSLAGIPGGKIEIAGLYDPTASTGPGAVLWAAFIAAVPVTGLVYPGGNTTGQTLWTITNGCLVRNYGENSTATGIVTWKSSIDVVILPVRTVV